MAMMPELHIYGPAFGLPSIDPECIAATTALSQIFQPNEWRSVVSSSGAWDGQHALPTLKHDDQCLGGFHAIRRHLKKINPELDEQATLDARQKAELTGLTHHLSTRGLPLIDTHLYTTSTNYISATRLALARFLPVAHAWSIPSQRYVRADARTASLGLTASTHSTTTSSTQGTTTGTESTSQPETSNSSPSLLFARGRAAQAALHKQAQTARFRLEGAVDALCEPLDGLLASNVATDRSDRQEEDLYLLGTREMTSADHLAYGYLSLLLFSDVPDRGVEELIRKRWARVVQYVERVRTRLADRGVGHVDAAEVQTQARTLGSRDRSDTSRAAAAPPSSSTTTERLPYALAPSPPPIKRIQNFASHILTLLIPLKPQHHIITLFTHPSLPLLTLLFAGSGIGVMALVTAVHILIFGKDKNLPQSVHVFRAAPRVVGSGLGLGIRGAGTVGGAGGGGEAGRILGEGFKMGGFGG